LHERMVTLITKCTNDCDPLPYGISVTACDRSLASVPKIIEVVKISFPQGLF